VLHRLGRRHRLELSEPSPQPAVAVALPVERRFDALCLQPAPALVTPVAPFLIAAVLDELSEALVRDRVALDLERRQVDDVSRPLVVVGPQPVVRTEDERSSGD
jgi:hypothetical protein